MSEAPEVNYQPPDASVTFSRDMGGPFKSDDPAIQNTPDGYSPGRGLAAFTTGALSAAALQPLLARIMGVKRKPMNLRKLMALAGLAGSSATGLDYLREKIRSTVDRPKHKLKTAGCLAMAKTGMPVGTGLPGPGTFGRQTGSIKPSFSPGGSLSGVNTTIPRLPAGAPSGVQSAAYKARLGAGLKGQAEQQKQEFAQQQAQAREQARAEALQAGHGFKLEQGQQGHGFKLEQGQAAADIKAQQAAEALKAKLEQGQQGHGFKLEQGQQGHGFKLEQGQAAADIKAQQAAEALKAKLEQGQQGHGFKLEQGQAAADIKAQQAAEALKAKLEQGQQGHGFKLEQGQQGHGFTMDKLRAEHAQAQAMPGISAQADIQKQQAKTQGELSLAQQQHDLAQKAHAGLQLGAQDFAHLPEGSPARQRATTLATAIRSLPVGSASRDKLVTELAGVQHAPDAQEQFADQLKRGPQTPAAGILRQFYTPDPADPNKPAADPSALMKRRWGGLRSSPFDAALKQHTKMQQRMQAGLPSAPTQAPTSRDLPKDDMMGGMFGGGSGGGMGGLPPGLMMAMLLGGGQGGFANIMPLMMLPHLMKQMQQPGAAPADKRKPVAEAA